MLHKKIRADRIAPESPANKTFCPKAGAKSSFRKLGDADQKLCYTDSTMRNCTGGLVLKRFAGTANIITPPEKRWTESEDHMKTTVHIISHSHWDREWYLPFEKHRVKLIELMDNAMELFEKDERYRNFHLDGRPSFWTTIWRSARRSGKN